MGFDKDRRPIWMPGRRDKLTTISSTATVIPSFGYSLIGASTKAGIKKFLIANPLPFTGSGGTEVNILTPNLITGSSAQKNIVVASTRTTIITNTTKPYKKIVIKPAGKRGATVRMISISTATYYVITASTAVSFSTSST